MLEQIRQSIEQAQMVLVGIGTEFAVKEEAQEDPFFTELGHCVGSPKWLEAQSLQGTLLYGRSMPLAFCFFLAWQ